MIVDVMKPGVDMNQLVEKISAECQKKDLLGPGDQIAATKELSYLESQGLLEDTWRLFQQIEKNPSLRGTKNKVNSLIAFGLGITTKRPSTQIQVEKRRTYGRDGFPDVDMDFDYERRHEIVEHIWRKYGSDYVGNIGTVQRLKTKAALRRAIKILDPENHVVFDKHGNKIKDDSSKSFMLENMILKTLPGLMKRPDGSFVDSVEDAYKEYREFRSYMDMYPEVRRIAGRMEGGISAYSCLAKDTPILTDRGWVRIDQLDKSCKVAYLDQSGETKYSSRYVSHMTGRKKLYKMTLENGDFIKVTDEHLIFTDQGCVSFDLIRKNPQKYRILSVKG